jgi:hypothetical protein
MFSVHSGGGGLCVAAGKALSPGGLYLKARPMLARANTWVVRIDSGSLPILKLYPAVCDPTTAAFVQKAGILKEDESVQ